MKQDDTKEKAVIGYTGLPVKITGIVFWGLVVVGLALAFLLMRGLEQQITDRHVANADRYAYWMDQYFTSHDGIATADLGAVQSSMEQGLKALKITAAELRVADQSVRVGNFSPDLVAQIRRIDIHMHAPGKLASADLVIYQPATEAVIVEERKRLLMLMGVLFLVFGFILQWVLHKLLSQPFIGMVQAAERFTRGDPEVRFEDNRADEFGYLGGFINKALDYVILQQQELRQVIERMRGSEADLAREKERLLVTLHSIGDGVITTDRHGNIEFLNPVAERLTGCSMQSVIGQPVSAIMQLIDEQTRDPIESPVLTCLREGEVVPRMDHIALLHQATEEIAIADSAAPIRDRDGHIIGAIMVFDDVGHARKLSRQLTYQASHDALTGLYNRREMEVRLQALLDSDVGAGQQHALCYIDLDQFKVVNDTCGHVAGDELLRQLAGLLHAQVRESDVLARLGGDEFGILLMHCSLDRAHKIAEDLRNRVKDYRFIWQDHSFEIGVSIGIAGVDECNRDIAEVMSAADVACYAAKDTGRNRVHVYMPDDKELKKRRGEMRWVSRLRKAIDEDRFLLFYQPIVNVADRDVDLHFEILIRLRDEQGREVPPMAFIPAAERFNLMPAIDRWVFNTTLDHLRASPPAGDNWVCVLNLSGQSLCDDEFLSFVIQGIHDAHIDPRHFCFEITETAAIANLRRAMQFISELRALGCRFALDDFGSGLSSFAYLKNLKVDYLKIDGSFVKDMVEDPIDRAMVEAITQIGHVMGIETIAEFVESHAILQALGVLGVDYAQGFWIAEPRPLQDLCPRVSGNASESTVQAAG